MELKENVQPLFNDVIVSMNAETVTMGDLIIPEGARSSMLSSKQVVLAVGKGVTTVEVGDIIELKMMNLMKLESQFVKGKTSQKYDEVEERNYIIDPSKIYRVNDKECLLINERDIAFKYLGKE